MFYSRGELFFTLVLCFLASSALSRGLTGEEKWSIALKTRTNIVVHRERDRVRILINKEGLNPERGHVLVLPWRDSWTPRKERGIGFQLFSLLSELTDPTFVTKEEPNPCFSVGQEFLPSEKVLDRTPVLEGVRGKVASKGYSLLSPFEEVIVQGDAFRREIEGLVKKGFDISPQVLEVAKSRHLEGGRFLIIKYGFLSRTSAWVFLEPVSVSFLVGRFSLPVDVVRFNAFPGEGVRVFVLSSENTPSVKNYLTSRLPSGIALPSFVKEQGEYFYPAVLNAQQEHLKSDAFFEEYSAWLEDENSEFINRWSGEGIPGVQPIMEKGSGTGMSKISVTRLFARFQQEHFAQDFDFREFRQGSGLKVEYVLRKTQKVMNDCQNKKIYKKTAFEIRNAEAKALASLTGWPIDQILKNAGLKGIVEDGEKKGSLLTKWGLIK